MCNQIVAYGIEAILAASDGIKVPCMPSIY